MDVLNTGLLTAEKVEKFVSHAQLLSQFLTALKSFVDEVPQFSAHALVIGVRPAKLECVDDP